MDKMSKQELQEEFNKLESLARRVNNANEDYKTGLLVDLRAEDDEVQRDPWQLADLEKTEAKCGKRLDEVRKAAEDVMWAQYGEVELGAKFHEAEAGCEKAREISSYSEHLGQITRLVQEASARI